MLTITAIQLECRQVGVEEQNQRNGKEMLEGNVGGKITKAVKKLKLHSRKDIWIFDSDEPSFASLSMPVSSRDQV